MAAPENLSGSASRRQLLLGGAAAGWGAAIALGADALTRGTPEPEAENGSVVVPFHGKDQAGLTVRPQAWSTFLALDLRADTDADALRRMMRLLSDDAARLTRGEPALADSEPELATRPARLTVTFAFGPALVQRAGGQRPTWLAPLPAFSIDRLQEAWSGGDLLIEVAADDPITVAHAVRMLLKDARAFGDLRWVQRGFRRAHGSEPVGTSMRNLFGQVDGTVNPGPDSSDFGDLVRIGSAGWLTGGSSLVVRRIAMDLEGWDRLDRPGREASVGRRLDNGAPLTGSDEHDEPDFDARDAVGFPVIAEFSHMRRARSDDASQRFYRRAFNYDDPPAPGQISNAGLIFTCYQADPLAQFVPIQQRLADLDLLNEWTIPIGSAVFAVPPGAQEGGFVGATLLT
ncbi:Dyp-type peroxidase [Pseudactinotalea sp.]|uniref:Dyp-type peroxidase n=1 Tax=Pseudactinotalea sp. TaxID=1926260 RepID=UPI003B3B919A